MATGCLEKGGVIWNQAHIRDDQSVLNLNRDDGVVNICVILAAFEGVVLVIHEAIIGARVIPSPEMP